MPLQINTELHSYHGITETFKKSLKASCQVCSCNVSYKTGASLVWLQLAKNQRIFQIGISRSTKYVIWDGFLTFYYPNTKILANILNICCSHTIYYVRIYNCD